MTPVEVGQWRQRGPLGTVWAVLMKHPTRRGFWLCAADEFPYEVAQLGRRELEAMRVVQRDFYGGGEHPGERHVRMLHGIRRTS